MSPPKGFYSFLDFNYTNGAIDLFEQTLRNSIDFNAMEDDVFEARVLTTPTKIVDNIANAGPIDVTDDDLNVKYAFRARILGPLSPHRFIEDPCELSNFQEEGAKERAFSVIQDHTKVVLYGPQDNPVIGDVVRIKLERTGKTYNTKDAKQYLGLVRSTTIPVKRVSGESCATLAEIFNGVDFNSLDSMSGSLQTFTDSLDGPNDNEVVIGKELSGLQEIVEKELQFWAGKKETDKEAFSVLEKYWENIGWTTQQWTPSGVPWSAAFISWVVNQVDSGFPKSAGHYYYALDSSKGVGGWTAWKTDSNGKIKAQVGDIHIRQRADSKNPTAGHGDVVFKIENGKAYLAGGNLGNSARVEKTLSLDSEGNYMDFTNYQIILKKNGVIQEVAFPESSTEELS